MIEEAVLQYYNDGLSIAKIKKLLPISHNKILDLLHRNNIKIRYATDYAKWNNELTKDKFVQLHINENKDVRYIAKTYGVSEQTLKDRMRKLGVAIKRPSIYTKNNKFFEQEQTADMAYLLGFIMADGCVIDGKLVIDIAKRDEEILIWAKNILSYTGPITYITRKYKQNSYTFAKLIICDQELVRSLSTYGIVQKKTGKERLPNKLEKIYYRDFVRGYFDGDGCIYFKHKPRLRQASIVCVNEKFLKSINKLIFGNICKLKPSNKDKMNLYCLRATSKDNLKQIYNTLYYDDSLFSLKRKKDKFKLAII